MRQHLFPLPPLFLASFLFGLFFLFLPSIALGQPRTNDCPTLQSIIEPVDLMFVFDDSGSMRFPVGGGDPTIKIDAARTAAQGTIDFLFQKSPQSRAGLIFLGQIFDSAFVAGRSGENLPLTSDSQLLKDELGEASAISGVFTPLVEGINTAAAQLDTSDTRKDVIVFFTDGKPEGPPGRPALPCNSTSCPLSGVALSITRAGVAFGDTADFNAVMRIVGGSACLSTPDPQLAQCLQDQGIQQLAQDANTSIDLSGMLQFLVEQVVQKGNPNTIDADCDGVWPAYCANAPGSICGQANPSAGQPLPDPPCTGSTILQPAFYTCTDFYDSPSDFGIPNTPDMVAAFRQALTKDLDGDGHDVADGRVPPWLPNPGGDDWYDNPFTSDLGPTKPTIAQLSHTVNDLDLDAFIAQSWKSLFGGLDQAEPDNADVAISGGVNRGGCVFPGALEQTCADCAALLSDPATGRIPAAKISSSVTNPKQVCQIEAYYEDLGIRKVYPGPGADISAATPPQTFQDKALLAVSAQCADGVDNDLDGLPDGSDLSCPKAGGLVPCGRQSDDPLTANDETRPCGFCHSFRLVHNIVSFLLVPSSFNNGVAIVPIVIAFLFAIGGFFVFVSAGNMARIEQGKKIIFATIIGILIIYGSWLFLNLLLTSLGVQNWVGFGTWWQVQC